MKISILSTLLGLSLNLAHAADAKTTEWYCTDVGSERTDNTVKACGVASAPSEGSARDQARRSAENEFNDLCQASSDCKGHQILVNPMRQTCEKDLDGDYKCVRLVVYTILKEMDSHPRTYVIPSYTEADFAKDSSDRLHRYIQNGQKDMDDYAKKMQALSKEIDQVAAQNRSQ